MKHTIISCLLLALFSTACLHERKAKEKPMNDVETEIKIDKITDTVPTFDTKAFAEDLLSGKAKVLDDTPTFACLDSLCASNALNRHYYWTVFELILAKSDGALSEVLGSYIYAMIEAYPYDFIHYYQKLDKKNKDRVIAMLAYESYSNAHSENLENESMNQDIRPFFHKAQIHCSQCESQELQAMKDIENAVVKAVKSIEAK